MQNAQTIVSEVGVDMSRWKTEKHFASWLGLCPDNRSSAVAKCSSARYPARSQSCIYRATAGGLGPTPEAKALWELSSMPATFQTRRPQSHHRDGPHARPFGLPDAEVLVTTTSTEELNSTKPNIDSNNCNESQNRPPLSRCNSFLLQEL